MASTLCNQAAQELLERCLNAETWPAELVRALATEQCSEILLRVVVEGLADRFEPRLCEVYAKLMCQAMECVAPVNAEELLARYQRLRGARFSGPDPARVFVLSRVTLGADVAVASVVLDGLKRRFPRAELVFAGPRKNWELFAADPRIAHLPLSYPRGSLSQRLAPWPEMQAAFQDGIVVDTDSRLTQLGLLPVCPEDRYFHFESRACDGGDALPELAARWMAETFAVEGARQYVALPEPPWRADITVSFGVGENPAKRIPDPFEEQLLRHLPAGTVCVDRGAGGEEAARVDRAVERSGRQAGTWDGSFAAFAAMIARSRLFVGYDSAGQHVAAACAVPLVCIFAGHPSPRMLQRWRPTGPGPIAVVPVRRPRPAAVLKQTLHEIAAVCVVR